MGRATQTVRGRIVMVQEQTFRLLTDEGRVIQLTLGNFAWPAPNHLSRFRDDGTLVAVAFAGEPGTATARATHIQTC